MRSKSALCIERYTSEVKRLHRVLDHRPAEAPYLAGEEYSIADIAAFPWVRQPERRGIDLADYPAVKRRHARFAARPAVERCCAVPAERARSGQIGDPERENLFGATQFQAR